MLSCQSDELEEEEEEEEERVQKADNWIDRLSSAQLGEQKK